MTPPTHPPMSPETLLPIAMSFTPYFLLKAALELDVFTLLSGGAAEAAEVAGRAGAQPRSMAMLLDALVGLELLTKRGTAYELAPTARQCLVKTSPDYMGGMLSMDRMLESWSHLADCVRQGGGSMHVDVQKEAEQFFPVLISGLHVAHRRQAAQLAGEMSMGHMGLRVLDIACGSGVWGIAFAAADPACIVTAQDFPGVLDHTKRYVERHHVKHQFRYLPGNLESVDFGEGAFDVAILGHIVHSEGIEASRALFRRLHRALAPGGRIVILDMIPNDERTGPPFPLLFALNMLLHTSCGGTYTLAEYKGWLTEAGFSKVGTMDLRTHSPAIVATRR